MSATPEQIAERLDTKAKQHRFAATQSSLGDGSPYNDAAELFENAAAALRAQAERVRVLEAEVAKLSKPEWFYNDDDGEYTYGDVDDVVDDMGYEGVMRVAGARQCWRKWVAVRCVALDVAGDIDETEVMTFETEAEALRCWPESLAACRARAALKAAP